MDSNNPKDKPAHLLSDLESIRQLLESTTVEPPVLTDSIDPQNIPLLSDIVTPAFSARPLPLQPIPRAKVQSSAVATGSPTAYPQDLILNRMDRKLRAAAELMLQDVIDDFVPQVESELRRRLQVHLEQLFNQRKP